MKTKRRIAIYDFCETIVQFQTANAFIDFVCNEGKPSLRFYLYRLFILINKSRLISVIYRIFYGRGGGKRLPALFLKGLSKTQINESAHRFYESRLKISFIEPVIQEILNRKKEGYEIAIISGGYEVYINEFAKHFPVDYVIANEFIHKDGKCTGRFGIDCMENNKVRLLKERIDISDADLRESYFYTDSISDLPLLSLVGNRIIVSKGHHQSWANQQNGITKEIIW